MNPYGRGFIPGMPPFIPGASIPPFPPHIPPTVPPMMVPFPPPFGIPLVAQPAPRPSGVEFHQITTIYVGKIPPGVEDDFIKVLLEQCGKVAQWRRVADPVSGKLKGFGFCDYQNPEGVHRALRVLSTFKIDDQVLLLKVDEKTEKLLENYQKAKRSLKLINNISQPQSGDQNMESSQSSSLEQIESEEKKEDERIRNILSYIRMKREKGLDYRTEIDPAKVEAWVKEEESKKSVSTLDNTGVDLNSNSNNHEREDFLEREKKMYVEKERESERDYRRKEREERDFKQREYDWENRERAKEKERTKEKEFRRDPDREFKDMNFDDSQRRRRTKEYLNKKRHREREFEDDEMDRLREKEEIYEEAKRKEYSSEKSRKGRQSSFSPQPPSSYSTPKLKFLSSDFSSSSLPPPPPPLKGTESSSSQPQVSSPPISIKQEGLLDRSKLSGFIIPTSTTEKKTVLPKSMDFSDDQNENENYQLKKKRKLITLETSLYDQEENKAKLKQVETIISKIPTDTQELFNFPINWNIIEENQIVEKKLRSWTTKIIVEYLGQEEKTLIDFILSKFSARTSPKELLTNLHHILDDDTNAFVSRLWRALVFEFLSCEQNQQQKQN